MATIQDWLDNLPELGRAHLERDARPLVTLSYAQSLDGCLTDRRGYSFPVSGQASLDLTHALRAAHAAILVGVGTVLADDPQLNVRRVAGANPQAVILDSHLRTPPGARLFQVRGRPVWIVATIGAGDKAQAALEGAGGQILRLPPGPSSRPALQDVLRALGERGISSLMVEGGATVISAFLQAQLADWAVITIAPVFLGGLNAVEAPLGPHFPRLISPAWEPCEQDTIVWSPIEYQAARPSGEPEKSNGGT